MYSSDTKLLSTLADTLQAGRAACRTAAIAGLVITFALHGVPASGCGTDLARLSEKWECHVALLDLKAKCQHGQAPALWAAWSRSARFMPHPALTVVSYVIARLIVPFRMRRRPCSCAAWIATWACATPPGSWKRSSALARTARSCCIRAGRPRRTPCRSRSSCSRGSAGHPQCAHGGVHKRCLVLLPCRF